MFTMYCQVRDKAIRVFKRPREVQPVQLEEDLEPFDADEEFDVEL